MRTVILSLVVMVAAGCAKHSDFVELHEELGNLVRAHDQTQKRQEAIQRRLQALEGSLSSKPVHVQGEYSVKGIDEVQQRVQDLNARLSEIERRLAQLEEAQSSQILGARSDDSSRQLRTPRSPDQQESTLMIPGTPSISPTSAFNLAYNDYLNGRYELAVTGFQRFLKDFPSTSLAPNAHYWLGESYFSLKDYSRAIQAFQKVVNDHPRSEKVPPALFKLGLIATETGDLPGARRYLKRVIEEFSTSDEAKLAKNKLAEIR